MSAPDEVPVSVTEQRLRDAFAAAAETVAPYAIRDLARPPDRRRVASRGPGRVRYSLRRCGWERSLRPPRFYEQALIPLAAAAAVAVIATAMSVVVPRAFPAVPAARHGSHQVTVGTGTVHPFAVAHARDLAAGYPRRHLPGGAAPRYFVGIRQLAAASGTVSITTLAVYNAVTGRVVASLGAPGRGRYYRAVAALGGDQTFVAAAVPTASQDCRTWFYRFSLGPQGRPTSWRPLPVPAVTGEVRYNNALAASADGNVVAYSASMCTQNSAGQVGVIDLATGKARTWATVWPAMPRTLSLSANGGVLSFVGNASSGAQRDNHSADTVWTLRTDAAPGPVASRYRKLLRTPGGVQAALLSPTGKIVFAMTAAEPYNAAGSPDVVNAYHTTTGKLIGLVQIIAYGSNNPGFSPSASGRYALIYPTSAPLIQKLDLVTGRLVTMSVPHAAVPFGAAW